jgi:thioredoxin-like negative regulator of GroEL
VKQHGSIEQKRAVLMLLARRFRPEFAPALKLALQDANPAIRVQAATATAEIESGFTDRTLELEAAARAAPDDFDTQLALARHYDAYAFCGLLDSAREHAGRRSALRYYGAALKLQPQNGDIRMAICRILVREGRHADAVDWLGQRLDQERSSRAIVGWYLECLFHLGRFAEVRGVAARFRGLLLDADEDDRLRQSAALWLAAGERAAA